MKIKAKAEGRANQTAVFAYQADQFAQQVLSASNYAVPRHMVNVKSFAVHHGQARGEPGRSFNADTGPPHRGSSGKKEARGLRSIRAGRNNLEVISSSLGTSGAGVLPSKSNKAAARKLLTKVDDPTNNDSEKQQVPALSHTQASIQSALPTQVPRKDSSQQYNTANKMSSIEQMEMRKQQLHAGQNRLAEKEFQMYGNYVTNNQEPFNPQQTYQLRGSGHVFEKSSSASKQSDRRRLSNAEDAVDEQAVAAL